MNLRPYRRVGLLRYKIPQNPHYRAHSVILAQAGIQGRRGRSVATIPFLPTPISRGRGARKGRVFSECGWRRKSLSVVHEVSRCGGGGVLGGAGCSDLDLGQVGGQVVGEPAVAGPEGLGLGGLGVPVMPNPSLKGSKATILSCRTRNRFRLPAKWMCLVVRPSIPVPACTVSSHSMGRLRKALGWW